MINTRKYIFISTLIILTTMIFSVYFVYKTLEQKTVVKNISKWYTQSIRQDILNNCKSGIVNITLDVDSVIADTNSMKQIIVYKLPKSEYVGSTNFKHYFPDINQSEKDLILLHDGERINLIEDEGYCEVLFKYKELLD